MADSLTPIAAVDDDHPLALELVSLRATASRYQHEAHAASLKLQRHSLDVSQVYEHARALERENARLTEEVTVLRANPDQTPSQTSSQVPELTLALRRLSDKLTNVEEILLQRTKEVTDFRSELVTAHYEVEAARALAAEARAREEEGLARERELERMLKAAEEERRMADLVVEEYADLVRKLEGRPKVPPPPSSVSIDLQQSTNSSTTTLADNLSEGRMKLQRLSEDFNGRNERLQADIAKLHGDNSLLYKELGVARQAAQHDRDELAKALHELEKYRTDDNTAAKTVSRYMKFSQSSTDTLQRAMDTLRSRHAATLATLSAEIAQLQKALSHERRESGRLRSALDELTEDIAREAYGRRREVSLRLAFLGREENLAESLRRWVRKAKERIQWSSGNFEDLASLNPQVLALREVFGEAMLDAESLLDSLNGQPTGDNREGPIARLVLAQDAVASLTHELQAETVRRLTIERKLARLESTADAQAGDEVRVVESVPHPMSHVQEQQQSLAGMTAASGPEHPLTMPLKPITPPTVVEMVTVPVVEKSIHPVSVASISVSDSSDHPLSLVKLGELPTAPSTENAGPVGSIDVGAFDEAARLLSSQPEADETARAPTPPASHQSVISPHSGTNAMPLPTATGLSAEFEPSSSPVPFPMSGTQSMAFPLPPLPSPLPLEMANGLGLSSLSPTSLDDASSPNESKNVSLLTGLARVQHRYDGIQRGFRDCHLALKELKKFFTAIQPPSTVSPPDMSSVLREAVDRLSDFNEDARVELEIRVADEERIASGYIALLSIPGAIASMDEAEATKVDTEEVSQEVRAFVDGSDRAVAKATQQFSQKLDDLEHDIASIKRTLHELSLSPHYDALSPTQSAQGRTSPSWSSWTPSFLSPARSTSPAPPTFGSVMTSPRLRHSTSFTHSRERSGDDSTHVDRDPLASLGLRIVVPPRSPTYGAGLNVGPPNGIGNGPARPAARQRATPGMFMLGLGGMRSTSFGQGPQKMMPSRSSLGSSSTPKLKLATTLTRSGLQRTAKDDGTDTAGEAFGNDMDIE